MPITVKEAFNVAVLPTTWGIAGTKHAPAAEDAVAVRRLIATLTGLPATVMPIGRSDENLPIGMQIIGPHLEDRTTIAFADLVARELGGFVAPPLAKK